MSKATDELLAQQAEDLAATRKAIMSKIKEVAENPNYSPNGDWWSGTVAALIEVTKEEREVNRGMTKRAAAY